VTEPRWRYRAPRTGVVSAFDDQRGLGTVEDGSGSNFDFHCTAITDGSRHIDVGTTVLFALCTGHLGRIEAADVQPLGEVGPRA
jgi:cold shock CspA family protein